MGGQPADEGPHAVHRAPDPVGAAGGVAKPVQHHGDYRSHMRTLTTAAILGAVSTFCSALALRAPDATVAVAAIALITAFVTWLAALHSTEDASGLALANPASAVTFSVVRRFKAASLLPIVAAQVLGCVGGGFAALGLERHLGGSLAWVDPSPIAIGVAVAVLGIVAAWVTLAVDGGESAAWSAVGPVLSSSALGVGLAAALNPAVIVGLATAGAVGWPTAGIAAGVGLVAAAAGAYLIDWVAPTDAA